MSVTITGLSRLALTDPHPRVESCYDAGHIRGFAYKGFERSTRGLADHDQPYGDGTCIEGRCYTRTGDTRKREVGNFGHTSYGEWRRELALAVLGVDVGDVWAEPDTYWDLPFYEVLNFADNEGTIGPEAAADLLADFREYRGLVPVDEVEFPGITPLPDRWIEALTLAADGGLVRFS